MQIASVLYRAAERQVDRRTAARQTILLALGGVVALAVTALVGAFAILTVLASFLQDRAF